VSGALIIVLCAAAPWFAAMSAGAEADCSGSSRRWVALRLPGPGWTPEFAASVVADLRVEIGRHGIDACRAETPGLPPPIVSLEITATTRSAMHLSLDIIDPATGEPSKRSLDLTSLPPDGHSLAVAVAADELLTSSWIKLASRPEPAPVAKPAPAPAAAVVLPSPPPSPPARNEIALVAAEDHFAGGAWQPGLDLALRRWLAAHWALELSAGARISQADNATHGRVRSRAYPIGLRAQASLPRWSARVRLGGAAALVVAPLVFDAEPAAGAVGASQTVVACVVRGELWADLRVGSLRLRMAVGAGAPVRSVSADDAGVPVAGVRGLALHGQAGIGWSF
jgi:hypothetical protein